MRLLLLTQVVCAAVSDDVWTQLTTTGGPPSGRERHSAVWSPERRAMLVFGGHDGDSTLDDVWSLSEGEGGDVVSSWR